MKRKLLELLLILALLGFIVYAVSTVSSGLKNFGYDIVTHHTSPMGKNVTLKYDFVSRPALYYEDELIWRYGGPGFMGTVVFDIQWKTENMVLLTESQYNLSEGVFINWNSLNEKIERKKLNSIFKVIALFLLLCLMFWGKSMKKWLHNKKSSNL